jgi:hypothetical protein
MRICGSAEPEPKEILSAPQHWLLGPVIPYCGTVRYGTVRYGTVRYGTVRYGTVRYGTVPVPYLFARTYCGTLHSVSIGTFSYGHVANASSDRT